MPDTKDDQKIIERAKKEFKLSEDYWSKNRENARDDIRFGRLGEQWPDALKKKREQEAKPTLTINKMPAMIRQVVNESRLNRPSIKVHPVDDNADIDTAEVMSGIIRNIEYTSGAHIAYENAIDNSASCGFGFIAVDMDYAYDDVFDMDLKIKRVADPLSVYPDENADEPDGSDWMKCFIEEVMTHEEFKKSYPNADLGNWETDTSKWITEDTVKVMEFWRRKEEDSELLLLQDGTVITLEKYEENRPIFQDLKIVRRKPSKTFKVTQYLLTSNEVLETVDWPGCYIPVVPVWGEEVVSDGEKHYLSLIRQAKDAARNYNYWRSASTEKVALATKAPWIGPTGSFSTDVRKWETANTDNHPYIEYDPINGAPPPQQTPPSMADAGAITEALSSNDDIKAITGIHDASLGIRSNETSGKAIQARQREGDVSTYHFIDNLARGIGQVGRILIDLIPYVYNKPRIARVIGADEEPDMVQINKEFDSNGSHKLHDLTKGKYDLVVKTGPSFSTRREEAATQMTEMLRSYPDAAPIIGDLIAKNLDWPGADEIAKRLKVLLPPEIQEMEKLDGLPVEAQAAIAQSQQQIKQLSQMIEQGKQMLMEKDEQIKMLEFESKSKQGELAVKDEDSKRKYASSMAKIEADKEMLAHKESEENRRLIIEETSGFIKDYAKQLQSEALTVREELNNEVLSGFEVFNQSLMDLHEKITELSDKSKSIVIQAPSGGVYQGYVDDTGDVAIEAPSGDVYHGNITEQ